MGDLCLPFFTLASMVSSRNSFPEAVSGRKHFVYSPNGRCAFNQDWLHWAQFCIGFVKVAGVPVNQRISEDIFSPPFRARKYIERFFCLCKVNVDVECGGKNVLVA